MSGSEAANTDLIQYPWDSRKRQDYAKDLDTRLQNSALARIAAPPTTPPTAAPMPGAELDKSDPLYAIKALNNAKDIFTNAVHNTLKSDEARSASHLSDRRRQTRR